MLVTFPPGPNLTRAPPRSLAFDSVAFETLPLIRLGWIGQTLVRSDLLLPAVKHSHALSLLYGWRHAESDRFYIPHP